MGVKLPTAWAELQHHGFRTVPAGTQRGLQPTAYHIFEAVTGQPRFPWGGEGDIDIRNDDRGTVHAGYAERERRRHEAMLRRIRPGRFVQGERARRANMQQ